MDPGIGCTAVNAHPLALRQQIRSLPGVACFLVDKGEVVADLHQVTRWRRRGCGRRLCLARLHSRTILRGYFAPAAGCRGCRKCGEQQEQADPEHASSDDRQRPSWNLARYPATLSCPGHLVRSEEHTSELQSLMRISYAVFCLKKKNKK